ncbi:MAG: hypothetical protein JXA25_10755 [Anaerolineales bacterium]|nr:hypothetical protein [Anaerolineales bacterium]
MKVKFPHKKKELRISCGKRCMLLLGAVLLLITFAGGMFFYRGGYATTIKEKILLALGAGRNISITEFGSEAADLVTSELQSELSLYQSNGLPTLFLDVPFTSMMSLEEKREEALTLGILLSTDEDYVPATLHFNDEQTLDIKIRLKGDWVDHLETDKWSFRVHITEADGAVLGMRRFSLQAPETRNYVGEWGFHQNLIMEDILTTRYTFLNVVLNGEHKGIFALEESFTEDLLESQGRREGVILQIDEDLMYQNWALFYAGRGQNLMPARDIGLFWLSFDPLSNEITTFRENRIADNSSLTAEYQTAVELLYAFYRGELPADQVLDEELWGRFFALIELWNAGHSTDWHNIRYYYNPVSGLIEPVVYDALALRSGITNQRLAEPFSSDPFFNSPGVQKVYIETLERITSPAYVAGLEEAIGEGMAGYNELLKVEYEAQGESLPASLELPWDTIEFRREIFVENLLAPIPLRGNYHVAGEEGDEVFQLDLVNMMVLPVQVDSITIGDSVEAFNPDWCAGESCRSQMIVDNGKVVLLASNTEGFPPSSFRLPGQFASALDEEDVSLTLEVRLYGSSRTVEVPIYTNYVPQGIAAGVKPQATLSETLQAHSFLLDMGEKQLAVRPGDWSVEGDLVLPEGYSLLIPGGAILRFQPDAVFLASGAVDIAGTEEDPVLITAEESQWGGLVVLDAEDTSTWNYVTVEKMAGIEREGWILTGGITFYKSELELSYSIIGNNSTEDALNVIRAPVKFKYVEFLNTLSDAFDGDFITGSISHCSFHDVQGDALDVSGSEISVRDTYFVGIGDKAVSAGEGSTVSLNDLRIFDVGIGVASKDLSVVYAEDVRVERAEVAALAAYIKKPQYGPAEINAVNITIVETSTPAICQAGSQLVLNGEEVPVNELDVDLLYEQGILGN